MLTNPIREENRELKQHLSPVLNTTSPFANDVHGREVEHFEQSFIRREDTFPLRDFAELAVIALDDVGCVDQPPNLRRVFKEGRQLVQLLRQERTMRGYFVPQISSNRSSSARTASSVVAL